MNSIYIGIGMRLLGENLEGAEEASAARRGRREPDHVRLAEGVKRKGPLVGGPLVSGNQSREWWVLSSEDSARKAELAAATLIQRAHEADGRPLQSLPQVPLPFY